MAHVHCEWGPMGVETLRERCAVLVIVDVLSFSTAVDVAVSRGGRVHPFPHGDEEAARAEAERVGARLASRVRSGLQLSLSPGSLTRLEAGEAVLLPSPNGSKLSLAGGDAHVLAGCLRNAAAVAARTLELAAGGEIGVVPAGEHWPDGSLRPAIEDLIGAGAVIEALDLPGSAEADLSRQAFVSVRPKLSEALRDCLSGRELIGRGFPEDVEIAGALNVSRHAPLLTRGAYAA